MSEEKHERTTKGLAKYELDLVIFGICISVVLWFGAGHLLFSFLLLSSTKVFQSAFVRQALSVGCNLIGHL
jgi:hypothetical protein